ATIHVADAFDAMTSTRSYRRALTQETAFEELRAGAGTQFNGQCVEALITAIERRDEHYGAGHETVEHDWAVAPPEAGTGSAGLGNLIPQGQAAGSWDGGRGCSSCLSGARQSRSGSGSRLREGPGRPPP